MVSGPIYIGQEGDLLGIFFMGFSLQPSRFYTMTFDMNRRDISLFINGVISDVVMWTGRVDVEE